METVWKTVEQYQMLEKGDNVLLGISGGPDSMALLDLLYKKRETYGIRLFVVHVDHRLRPEAKEEAEYVRSFTEKREIPFRLFSVDVQQYAKMHHMSFEQAGHEVRFSCFQEAAKEWQITKIALGHHRDDRVETVLMHMIQGTGLDGLCAMPARDGKLIRPLANVSKEDLIRYCEEGKIRYFTDQTNLETDCLRNKIRLELIPQMEQYNGKVKEGILRMEESASADLDFLEKTVDSLCETYEKKTEGGISFPKNPIRDAHTAIQRRLLRRLYRNLTGTERNLTFRHTEQMRQMLSQDRTVGRISLPGHVIFSCVYEEVRMQYEQNDSETSYCVAWDLSKTLRITGIGEFSARKLSGAVSAYKDLHTVFTDAQQTASVLQIRTRKSGDQVQPVGMNGHKSLKKFMIDRKIPAKERARLPIVTSGDEIIWIPGYFFGEKAKITEKTTECYRLDWKPFP